MKSYYCQLGNIVLGTEPVNVTVTQQSIPMPAVYVVPTTNKLITAAVLFEKLEEFD
jgi:hypothetical protein